MLNVRFKSYELKGKEGRGERVTRKRDKKEGQERGRKGIRKGKKGGRGRIKGYRLGTTIVHLMIVYIAQVLPALIYFALKSTLIKVD